MAITLRSTSSGGASGANSSSAAMTKPAGTAAGDLLLAVITVNDQTVTAPSGWTLLYNAPSLDLGARPWRTLVYWRLAGGSEAATYTWTVPSATGPMTGTMTCWTGCDQTTPIGTQYAQTTHAGLTVEPTQGPSVTTTTTVGRVVYIRSVRQPSASDATLVFSETETDKSIAVQRTAFSGGSTVYANVQMADDADFAGSGTKNGGLISVNKTESDNNLATIVLKMAATPATGEFDSQLQPLTGTFTGERVPNTGTFSGQLSPLTGTLSGVHLIPAVGAISGTLASPTATMSGSTPVLGSLVGAIQLTAQLTGETRQFGEHIIVVEREDRAFLVVDDNSTTGLKPIKRSRVTDA
jgi:hypothetical protein